MKSKLKTTALTSVVLLILGLQIAVGVACWNEPEYSVDPDSIDIGPQIQQMLNQQQEARMKKVQSSIDRSFAAARVIGHSLRDRWADAQQRGLVGETGVLYVPTDQELKFDGSIPEFGRAQVEPPATGWYVVFRKFKTPSGRIKAKTEVKRAQGPVAASRPGSANATSPAVK
jgi:hypothetical protein